MLQLTTRILLASLLIGLVPAGAAQAQQEPPGTIRQFPTRFAVVDAPEHFDQVLQIVDFAPGAWTPIHTPGGYVYNTVLDGAISTRRSPLTGDVDEVTYEPGDTFVEKPGDFVQVGNASSGTGRILATAVLPARAPLTIYQDGFTSSAYPSLTNWNYTHDLLFSTPGPETVHRSVTHVDRPEGPFELVQLVLDVSALHSAGSNPDWAQLAALYYVLGNGNTTSDQVGESCLNIWGRLAGDAQTVYPHQFERAATNLCVSSAYMPIPGGRPNARAVDALDDPYGLVPW